MKVLFLTFVLLLGYTLAEEQEEAEVSSLQDIEEEEEDTARLDQGQTVTIAQVNPLDLLNQLLATPAKPGVPLPALNGLNLGTTIPALITGVIGSITAIKTALTGLLLGPVGIAIDVLVIIALVLLIKYLVENKGDVKGLIGHSGYADSGYDYSGSSSYASTGASGHYRRSSGARSLFDTPAVQMLTNVVYDAIEKYAQ